VGAMRTRSVDLSCYSETWTNHRECRAPGLVLEYLVGAILALGISDSPQRQVGVQSASQSCRCAWTLYNEQKSLKLKSEFPGLL
jgi:hypothetical protein